MNPLDIRKQLKALAQQMQDRRAPSDEQYQYLQRVLERISDGEDANQVLGVSFGRGKKLKDAEARQKLSLILQWVAQAITPIDDDLHPGLGYTLDRAFEEAASNASSFGVSGKKLYDADYIKKCWYAKDKQHMQSPVRQSFEPDSPF